MTDQLLLLRDLIHYRTGLFFQDYQGLEVIAARLTPRLEKNGCTSFSEYIGLLSRDGLTAADEWLQVAALLSKSKTSFLRHKKQAQALANEVIPQWLLNSGAETLKIWSAGCSTGEELLTIAMTLSEVGWLDRIPIELYGSDASFVVIEEARRGVYSESKANNISPELRFKYFKPVEGGWQVKPELHERIRWSVANLRIESEIAGLASSHIIFCNNVFIYFSEPAICQTLRLFGRQMPEGGCLFSSTSDYFTSLMFQVGLFQPREIGNTCVWMKRIGNSDSAAT